jgi:hypothetical protein
MAHKKPVGKSPMAGGPNKPARAPMAPWRRNTANQPRRPGQVTRVVRSPKDPKPSRGQTTKAHETRLYGLGGTVKSTARRPGQQTGYTTIPLTKSYDYTTGVSSVTNRGRPASYRELQALQRQQATKIKYEGLRAFTGRRDRRPAAGPRRNKNK